ncbi:MAG: hypothetical protein ACLFUY_05000 [Desulfobacterales bacterium]
MRRFPAHLLILPVMLVGLPLLGAWLFLTRPLGVYFDFPPSPGLVSHAPFSWPVFIGLAALIAACAAPFVSRAVSVLRQGVMPAPAVPARAFPAWGWLGVLICATAWILAWTRFEWLAGFQPYTFPFLWIGFILAVNALAVRRAGTCLLVQKPVFFLALFPASAVFWWFFEYLNRFVLNWYYINVDMFAPWEYIVYASICFATVLPGVLSVAALLRTFSFFERAYADFIPIRPAAPRGWAAAVLVIAAAGLFFLGLLPNLLFPLLWVSPLLIIVCLQVIAGQQTILAPIRQGDWHRAVCFAAAALVCGFFWEMWNYWSMAKWEYSIPFVHAFQVFEMPVLGYAGYLPFGLECAVVGDILQKACLKRK